MSDVNALHYILSCNLVFTL